MFRIWACALAEGEVLWRVMQRGVGGPVRPSGNNQLRRHKSNYGSGLNSNPQAHTHTHTLQNTLAQKYIANTVTLQQTFNLSGELDEINKMFLRK